MKKVGQNWTREYTTNGTSSKFCTINSQELNNVRQWKRSKILQKMKTIFIFPFPSIQYAFLYCKRFVDVLRMFFRL